MGLRKKFLSAVLGIGSLLSVSALQAKEQEGLSVQEQATQLSVSFGATNESDYRLFSGILKEVDEIVQNGVSVREATILVMNTLEITPTSLSPEMKAVLMENLVGADDGTAPADIQAQADTHIRSLYSGSLVKADFDLWTQKQNKTFMEKMARDDVTYQAREHWDKMPRSEREVFMRYVAQQYFEQIKADTGVQIPDFKIEYADLPADVTGQYSLTGDNVITFNKVDYDDPKKGFNDVMDTFMHEVLGHGFHKELSKKPIHELPNNNGLKQAALFFRAEMDPSGATNFRPSAGNADAILYTRSPTENMSMDLGRTVEVMGIFSSDGKAINPEIEKRYALYVQNAQSKIDFFSKKAKNASIQEFKPPSASNMTL